MTDELYLNVKFKDPVMVSIGMKKDMIIAEVANKEFFSRTDAQAGIEEGTQVKLWLPRLLSGDAFEETVNEIHETVDSSAQYLLVGNLFTTVILAISFKSIWNLLNVMQVLVFMRYFTPWPASVDAILVELENAITLRPFVDPIFEYGKTQF